MRPAVGSGTARTAALMVEGGGLRGAFSAGVVDELSRTPGLRFDDVVAVSSGAPTSAYLVTEQMDEAIRVWEEHTHGTQLLSPQSLLRGGPFMDIDRLVGVFERVRRLDTARIGQAATRLWISVTNCRTGEVEYVRATPSNTLELLRATMAIPIAYGRVVQVEGTPYIDGGVVQPIPIEHVERLGHSLTVAVLTQPRGYRRGRSALTAYVMGRTYKAYPGVGRALAERWRRSNEALSRVEALEDAGELHVIRPLAPLPASRLSTRREAICATLEAGRQAARAWRERVGGAGAPFARS